jgi:hypothetical protein
MPSPDRGEVRLVDLGLVAKVRPGLVLSTAPQDRGPEFPREARASTPPLPETTRPTAGLLPARARFGETTGPVGGLETHSAGPRPTGGPAQCRPCELLCEGFSPCRPRTCAATGPKNPRIALTELQS